MCYLEQAREVVCVQWYRGVELQLIGSDEGQRLVGQIGVVETLCWENTKHTPPHTLTVHRCSLPYTHTHTHKHSKYTLALSSTRAHTHLLTVVQVELSDGQEDSAAGQVRVQTAEQ